MVLHVAWWHPYWPWPALGRRDSSSVDSGHPDTRFVYFEEIGDQRIEIDVRVGKVKERELLPIPEVVSSSAFTW